MSLLLTGADVAGFDEPVDVHVQNGKVAGIVPRATARSRSTAGRGIDAAGCALIPGLHDHHLHLLAMAAAGASLPVGPGQLRGEDDLRRVLAAADRRLPPGAWVRAVGYHESVAGVLDRDRLDVAVPGRPVRVQHRSGALWVLNSAGLRAAGIEDVDDPDVERDRSGRVTGRLWRWDSRLRRRLPPEPPPDLRAVGTRLAAHGITGVTDATPDLDDATLAMLGEASRSGALVQELTLLGVPLEVAPPPGVHAGPFKLLLHDHDLPTWTELTERIRAAHGCGRPVAVHCVTREALLLTLAALEELGTSGDRIEHAAVVPAEAREQLARLGVRVVTQPGFLADRGDDYLRDVDPQDRQLLYPYASLCAAGVAVAASSDAPYGPESPWDVIAAACDRRAPTGRTVGADERVGAARALDGYLSAPDDPGGSPRRLSVGSRADLVLLDRPLAAALGDPAGVRTRLTLRAGRPVAGA